MHKKGFVVHLEKGASCVGEIDQPNGYGKYMHLF